MAFSLTPLPSAAALFDDQGRPTILMTIYWQQVTQAIVGALDTLAEVSGTTLPDFNTAIMAAQHAADLATTAAGLATAAASTATATSKLVNSYISPSPALSASSTVITIVAHTRYYADGTSVAVNGGTVAATAPGATDYVSYSDPTFAGGTVTYVASTTNPAQIGATHVVGAVTVPTTGSASGGGGPRQPGTVQP